MKVVTNKTVKTAAQKPGTDPIEIAKRNLDFARADYKRIKEINEGTTAEKQVHPERAEIRKQLTEIKQQRLVIANEIKTAKQLITEKRKVIKDLSVKKNELQAKAKTTPRAVKNSAVKEAQIAVLEAELAWRKACLG